MRYFNVFRNFPDLQGQDCIEELPDILEVEG